MGRNVQSIHPCQIFAGLCGSEVEGVDEWRVLGQESLIGGGSSPKLDIKLYALINKLKSSFTFTEKLSRK